MQYGALEYSTTSLYVLMVSSLCIVWSLRIWWNTMVSNSFLDFWCVHAKSLRTIWIGKTFASTQGCAGFAVAWARAPGTIIKR